ncbi:MAG: hypothetical protein ACLP9S_02755 [Syntrophales bacterium]
MSKRKKKKKLSPEARKLLLNLRKKSVLLSISKIKVRFHKIWLSGSYNWNQLEERIGKLKMGDNSWMPKYRTLAYRQLRDRSLTIFVNPIDNFLPHCFFGTSYPTQAFLVKLNMLLPGLNISSVEYTIDMFSDFISVRNNFCILRRYLYFPHQNNTELYKDGELRSNKYNVTLEAKKMKMYERGPDDKRMGGAGWPLKDIDRLRIEFTADRNDLNRAGIRELENFIKDSKFSSIMESKFKFRRFKKTAPRLPREWEIYKARDLLGHIGSFQSEYELAKIRYQNVGQYLEDVKELRPLYSWLLLEMAVHEDNWVERYNRLQKKYSGKGINL